MKATKKITKVEIYQAWNEIEEVITNLEELSPFEIMDLLDTIKYRLITARNILHPFCTSPEEKQSAIEKHFEKSDVPQ